MAETAEVEVPTEAPSRPNDRIGSSATDLMNTMTSLHDQIATLRMQNSEYQARLLDLMVANETLQKQVIALNKRIDDSTKPPLFIASVLEVRGHEALIRQHGNNQELLVEYDKKLEVGMRVAVNNDLQIIRVLSGTIDERALIMEVIDDPDAEYEKIGGLDSQIQEVKETVELPLTSPELFETVGVEPPRGVLLYGPPGTGKTLLAKAVAHHADATFIKMSGSELVHKFIGEGARLVRDVFQLAREKSPTILFVDEIDAVGGRRTHDGTVGSAEVNRTMTQILTELDGFGERGDVRVMAATNRIDLLDPALLRPGRFDRVIEIPAPNEAGRLQILSIHTKNMSLAGDVDLATITKETDAATGADLKILVTEAGMNAIRNKRQDISMADFRYALDKLTKEEKNEPHGMFV
ncbi:MAG: Proteasome-activating nucleotidase 1 [Candidatus Methanogaster sp.]|nr:MAG: Proteasome-activating nucleotidase 1 [ANME-2 cluster archaeon]